MNLTTFKDITERLADYLGGANEKDARDYRRAARDALREIADSFPWGYYVTQGRLNVFGAYSTGTIAFDLTGGAYERLLTLTDGTWPAWAADGTVEIGGLQCEVEQRISDTLMTLTERACPGEDVDAGTSYSLWRDSYPAPSDFYKPITGLLTSSNFDPEYIEAPSLGDRCRPLRPSIPSYTIVGDPNYLGVLAFRFDPAPSSDQSYEYWYRRSPRDLTIESYSDGTVEVADGSAVVTGTGTSFSQKHVGTVLRISSDDSVPTSYAGDNPADTERIVLSVESATSLTVDSEYVAAASGKAFVLSDPVDVAASMRDYLYATIRYRLAIERSRMDGLKNLAIEKDMAMKRSVAADNKSTAGRRWVGRDEDFERYPVKVWPNG